MAKSILQRLLWSIAVIVGVLVVVFLVGHVVGDPARLMVGEGATAEDYQRTREALGLDDPIYVQLARFGNDALFNGFGDSLWQGVPALELALARLPATLLLAGVTIAVAVPIAVAMGTFAALHRGSFIDRTIDVLSLAATSLVEFWIALILILVVAVWLRLLPTSGFGSPEHLILPVVTLSLRPVGRLAQMTRTAVDQELSSDYIEAGRARGLSERRLVWVHALRNASLPILTLGGNEVAGLANGAVIAEVVFAWPGIGLLMLQAIELRDLPLIEAAVFITTVTVLIVNLLVDLAYLRLNPRVRTQGAL